MFWIDAHAHMSFLSSAQVENIFTQGASKNLKMWIMAGYDSQDWEQQLVLFRQYPDYLRTSFGLHPWKVFELSDQAIEDQLKTLSTLLPLSHACGETGIDAFRAQNEKDLEKQERVFREHLEANRKFELPLVLHVVKAHLKTIEILKNYNYSGIVHGFSGSCDDAKKYVELGFKISIGKGVFLKGYKGLKEAVRQMDLEHLVLESDMDDGNDDAVSIFFQIAQAVAEIKGVNPSLLLQKNYENLAEIFKL
jgi:TatD DNase family protein